MKKYVDTLKAHFDFPSAKSVRITTPYFQKVFNLNKKNIFVELERLKEIKPPNLLDLPNSDFFVEIEYEKKYDRYHYLVYAKTNENDPDIIETVDHNKEKTIKVNIYRG